ncbi:GumC family protein [Kordiimonas laminariae]|uniref:GumC family protein n=1 Tax=Kordiimonas laminariae TaxID=2917717 RepID=UPI001FF371A5|nr:hypothetical protein [Kordiimonas laminariae]MCK0067852.1 hypothetical protein [Kordiimonas laminariae]
MTDTIDHNQTAIGNEDLWQVRDFVEEAEEKPVNPIATLARLYRGQWLKAIVTSLVLGILLGVAAIFSTKPTFESEGLVRVAAKSPKILYADKDDSRLRLYDAFVSAEATYLQSQQVLERAHEIFVDKLEERGETAPFPTLKDFADSIAIKKLKGLISITSKNPSAVHAQQSVNALLESYSKLHMEQSGSRTTLRARELEVRVSELSSKQKFLGEKLLAVGEEYDSSSLAKAHLTKVTQLEELDIRIDELSNTLLEMEASNGALDADTGDMEIKRATLLDRAMADMVFERAKRAAELQKLLLRYQPSHPKVQTLSASLDVIDTAIESRRRLIATLGKTGAITGADGAEKSQSLAELHALKRKLSTRRKELSDAAKDLNGKLIELKRLNEEKSQIAGMLAETRRILDQVRLESRNSLPGTIEILSRASMPNMPASDKRKQFAALGFIAGAGLGALSILILRQLSGRILYSDDLAVLLPPSVDNHVFPKSPAKTDYINFLGELQLMKQWRSGSATIVSITRFEEDTKIPLSSLAEVSSNLGLRTLLVCASEEDSSSATGFSDQIRGKAPLKKHEINGFHYVPYGKSSDAAGYTLEQAQDWLKSASTGYDLVLLYTGISERHISSRLLPSLADIQSIYVAPGVKIRPARRLIARAKNLLPVFVNPKKGDPGCKEHETTSLMIEGVQDEKVA